MKEETTAYSRLVRMLCTPFAYPLSDKEIKTLKVAENFTVRYKDYDLPTILMIFSGVGAAF